MWREEEVVAKNAEIAAGWRVQELGTKKMVDTVVG